MELLIVFTAGVRNRNGIYREFISSTSLDDVNEYIEIMKSSVDDDLEIVLHEKTYNLVSTTPRLISRELATK